MKYLAPFALALAVTACAQGPRMDRLRPTANPSAVIAAELAFAQLAQTKGQWAAFRETSTGDATMFVPQPVRTHDWLKGRAEPPAAIKWQPHQVWSSCDGSLAVTRGAWQRPDSTVGYFTTVWQRQKNGTYKWVLDQGDALDMPLPAPEMIGAKVADCRSKEAIAVAAHTSLDSVPANGSGVSLDNTLAYDWSVEQDRSRRFSVSMMLDGKMVTVVDSIVTAPVR